jgi:histidinol-phosphate aminotransferase
MTTLTPIRLDRNEGAPPDEALLAAVVRGGAARVREYPDEAPLEALLAGQFNADPAGVVVTTGADGALERACRIRLAPGTELLLTDPTFEMFPLFAAMTGATPVSVPWLEGRFPLEEFRARIRPATRVIALVSPNNPTGLVMTIEDVAAVAEAAPPGALVIFDHVYADYAREDLTAAVRKLRNTVVVRTFSKAWGLAGCRVGYALTEPAIAREMREAGPPYAVAGLSLALAMAAIERGTEPITRHLRRIAEEREDLRGRLQLWGAECAPSQGNFLFPSFGGRVEAVRESLAQDGILVRRFPNNPLIADALRISLPGDPIIYDRLLRALARALGGAS